MLKNIEHENTDVMFYRKLKNNLLADAETLTDFGHFR